MLKVVVILLIFDQGMNLVKDKGRQAQIPQLLEDYVLGQEKNIPVSERRKLK